MFLLGLALFFALPLLGLFLLFPLVTAPISVLIFLFIAVLWAFSIPFAGYVLGRCLFKKVKPLGAGMLGVVILTAVCYVPYFRLSKAHGKPHPCSWGIWRRASLTNAQRRRTRIGPIHCRKGLRNSLATTE